MAEELAPRYIRDRPNSYTFTKSVAEYMVASEATDIPTIIVRPSIVGPTWKEPVAGWSDNFNGVFELSHTYSCAFNCLLSDSTTVLDFFKTQAPSDARLLLAQECVV